MTEPHAPTTGLTGNTRKLWPLGLMVLLLVFIPICLTAKSTLDRLRSANSADEPVAIMATEVLDGLQKTGLVVIAALALLSLR